MLLEKTLNQREINETIYYAIVFGVLKYDPSFLLDFTGTGSLVWTLKGLSSMPFGHTVAKGQMLSLDPSNVRKCNLWSRINVSEAWLAWKYSAEVAFQTGFLSRIRCCFTFIPLWDLSPKVNPAIVPIWFRWFFPFFASYGIEDRKVISLCPTLYRVKQTPANLCFLAASFCFEKSTLR